ncbi:MAG: dipeptide epimerase [Rhodospirillales bacterium]|nr:dipeptide epimerase [Rhodospirillales bacterium]MDH3790833.1 dipeptide epimerase [Rhodospirillales bacterium]MDH3911269.1 dipeptide epimerase [Rhodospirillales bacterium]MDH3918509.1 dipeptide epimerase [Rhodospirillales bacterium]MDH3966577.1 dipeptide epimerase [Rhodospirillales bacterium]
MTELAVRAETWPLRGSFTISRGSRTAVEVVVVELTAGGARGRGECVPYARYGETVEGVVQAIEGLRGPLSGSLDRTGLQGVLPAGAARNAVDCAFWDLEAKQAGRRVWELIGQAAPGPVTTAYTLSLDTAAAMARAAAENAWRPLLKLKLAGPEDLARVEAVREAAPETRLIVDANEGWAPGLYAELAPHLAVLGVEMIEQPLPAGHDAALATMQRPVAVAADESCHDTASLSRLAGRYDMVNIKLDKTGGLTEALSLKAAAQAEGYGVMVGCMLATSLAMAPAVLVARDAQIVDLDGPLLLERDRPEGLVFEGSLIHPPQPNLWG